MSDSPNPADPHAGELLELREKLRALAAVEEYLRRSSTDAGDIRDVQAAKGEDPRAVARRLGLTY